MDLVELGAAENTQQMVQAPGAAGRGGQQHHFCDQHVPVLALLTLVASVNGDVLGLDTG